jgi:activator of Hsp90 ATPase-like protein
MHHKNYKASIEVARSAEVVFSHINEVSKWWSKDFEGRSAKLNDEFIICHPGLHFSKQRVVEMVLCKKVVWLVTESELSWLEKDKQEWTNTRMVFEISAREDKTVVDFTHEGLVPEKECYARCQQGWDMVIKKRLFEFITEGKGIVETQ